MIESSKWVLFLAPKTGCTSVTHAMRNAGYYHRNTQWHISEWRKDRRPVFAMYRDPFERLLSLWGHGMASGGKPHNLEEFVEKEVLDGPLQFYSWNQAMWYRNVGVDDFIFLNYVEQDFKEKLGLSVKVPTMNKSRHLGLLDAMHQWPNAFDMAANWIAEDTRMLERVQGDLSS